MSPKTVILIIDDNETLLTRLKQRLQSEGYEVLTTTQTVGTARYLLKSDLVLIDFHMPGIDGGEIVSSLKGACRERQPKFYLYSSDARVAPNYKALGFDGVFIQKGDDTSLVKQLAAALRMTKLTALKTPKPEG
jgi:CheY-like chemotaxis protein